MKIAIVGLWHLGTITAACLADAGFDIIAYDSNTKLIEELQQKKPPLFEPGLNELLEKNPIFYSYNKHDLKEADIVWVTYDTPINDQDVADVEWVKQEIICTFPYLKENCLVLISSQLPVGTTRQLQQLCKTKSNITFAYSPENLKLGKAIEAFKKPDRIIVGYDSDPDKLKIAQLFQPFSTNIIWMSIESAEMTKHALNAFLATSVVFINELAVLCERVGADAREVEQGLKSDTRIGNKAYLKPGQAIAGGTLARDVNFLTQTGQKYGIRTPLFNAILESNHAHKRWVCLSVQTTLKNLHHKTIAMLGLTYKAGTDTLRRSIAVETCHWLSLQGAKLIAYDPHLTHLPNEISQFIELKHSLHEALSNTDAILIANECTEFQEINPETLLTLTKKPHVFDPSGFLVNTLGNDERIRYFSVGRAT